MLAKRVIPCLDVHDGKVTRGVQFGRAEAGELRNVGDPVELAVRYNDQGADEMVFFDITASAQGRASMIGVIERAADQCFMPLTAGGGIRSVADMHAMLKAGADKTSINSSALADPALITRGVQFGKAEAGELRNVGDPVALALRYNEQGADEMVFFDITASAHGRATMIDVIQRAADECFMPLTVGGGIRSVEDMHALLRAGADKTSINSSALATPDLIRQGAEKFGSQCVVVSIDAKKVAPGRWEVFSHGGRKATGLDAVEWAKKAVALGAGEIVLNSIDADGTKAGFDLEITRRVSEAVGVPVVASGGAGTLEHMAAVLLEGKADAVLAASIFHFGQFTVGDVKKYLAGRNIPVRL